jgi:hypothetical protein
MSRNSKKKIQIDILTFYVGIQFSWENNILCVMYKKYKNVLYIVMLEHQNLSVLHGTQKMFFFLDIHATNY